jgi:hypothetical protein
MEESILFGGRTDVFDLINALYLSKRESHDYALYSDIAALLLGAPPKVDIPGINYAGYYGTAPVFEVVSPDIKRPQRNLKK